MKLRLNILLIILLVALKQPIKAQNFADKSHYLVDSLDLSRLTPGDIEILNMSLERYHQSTTDTAKIRSLNPICSEMMSNEWIKYQYLQHDLIQAALKKSPSKVAKNNLDLALAGALNNLGYIHKGQGDFKQAERYYQKSLAIFKDKNDEKGMSDCYNNIGVIYYSRGAFEEALTYYHKALKIDESMDDTHGLAHSYNNIGYVYQTLKESDQALSYYKRSMEMYKKIDDKPGIGMTYNNLGVFYSKQNKNEEALEYYEKALALLSELGDQYGMAGAYNNIGQIYDKLGKRDLAIEYYKKSEKINEEIGDKHGLTVSYSNLGGILLDNGNYKESRHYLEKGVKLAKEVESPMWLSELAGWMSELEAIEGNYKPALEYYKLKITMRDSLNNEENQKAAAKQQAKYEYEKQKVIDDAEHEKQLAIEQEAKAKQQIITYATAGGLGLVGIFLIFVFNRLKVTRKQKGIIELAHHELEDKNQEIMDSITYAKRIQSAILPPSKVVKEYLQESFILYKPKDIVAGDFYWLESVKNKVLFAAADCTGHGVPGAMVSVVCNNGLNRSVREYGLTDPGKILDKTREIVVQEFQKSEEEVKDGMDIALCSLEGNTLHYAGAHNPLWIIRKGADTIQEIKADKQPIGQTDNPSPYTTHKIELNPGDTIYLFSDGYADQFGGEKGKKMKTANFKKLLLSLKNEDMQSLKALIDDAFEDWKGELDQLDDICVIGVRV